MAARTDVGRLGLADGAVDVEAPEPVLRERNRRRPDAVPEPVPSSATSSGGARPGPRRRTRSSGSPAAEALAGAARPAFPKNRGTSHGGESQAARTRSRASSLDALRVGGRPDRTRGGAEDRRDGAYRAAGPGGRAFALRDPERESPPMNRRAPRRGAAYLASLTGVAVSLTSVASAQEGVTGTYALEGELRAGGRYAGRVVVWVDGEDLALSTWDAAGERARDVARTDGLAPDAAGAWTFRFGPAGDGGDAAEGGEGADGIAGALSPGDGAPPAPPLVTITASALRLRSAPSLSAAVVGRVLRGERHRVLESRGAWRRLDLPGGPAWAAHHHPTTGAVYMREAAGPPPAAEDGAVLEVRRGGGGLLAVLRRDGEAVARERLTPSARPPEELVFVGMGAYAHDEARDLRSRGVRLLQITQSLRGEDVVARGGRRYDLAEEPDREAFAAALGLDAGRADRAAAILAETRDDARDELARLLEALVEAERGERTFERLVFSGHSVGSGVWGDDNGSLSFRRAAEAFGLFPEVAAGVEDVMIAGCYSASPAELDSHRAYLPNLKTYWAYGTSAPGSWTGAMLHNARWEAATRGHDYARLTRRLAEGTRKGENVATWNVVDGFQRDGEFRSAAELRAALAEQEATYREFFAGERDVVSTQSGPLRVYYAAVQELRGLRATPAAERRELARLRDQVIRLIFYDARVKQEFQAEHGDEVAAGWAALGLPGEAPDFAALSRADALAAVARFRAAYDGFAGLPPAAASEALRLLEDGLRDLRAERIPDTWV